MTEASYTKAVCPVCETIVDVGDFLAWGAGRCPGCGWQWWWDSGPEKPVVDWARTPTSRSLVTEKCIQALRMESEGSIHREGSSADYLEHTMSEGIKMRIEGLGMNTKPKAMPCARCPSHFFDPDPKAGPPCSAKIRELQTELEQHRSFRERWVVKAKDGGNDFELVECSNCKQVGVRLEAVQERILDYHNLVCPGDSAEQTLHDIEEIMESDDPANWVQGENENAEKEK